MPGRARGLGRAHDRAEVAGIGDAVDRDEERALRPRAASSRSAGRSGGAIATTPWCTSLRAICSTRSGATDAQRARRPRSTISCTVSSRRDRAREVDGPRPALPGAQQLEHRPPALDLVAAELGAGPCSLAAPLGPSRRVLDDDAAPRQLVADPVGLGPVLGAPAPPRAPRRARRSRRRPAAPRRAARARARPRARARSRTCVAAVSRQVLVERDVRVADELEHVRDARRACRSRRPSRRGTA